MAMQRATKLTLFLLLLLRFGAVAQPADALPRSTPEAEGVSPDSIAHFLDAVERSNNEFHSFMMLRHGKVIAEGWWNPYRPDLRHTMYSVSKSFTATAIGFAVSEKRLTVEDKVVLFFPTEVPANISPYMAELRVRDLLSMSAGQEPDPTSAIVPKDSNWVKAFLSTPILHKPGTKFLYNSMCTYMLSAIVQKVTGEKVVDYLTPRLFTPLGIVGMDWETDPRGTNVGGWGLRIKTEDMAKFGQLFLQKGQWQGQQVLPADWVEAASTLKIIQHPELPEEKRASSDWEQGYCYQMWRCRHNAYRGDGAFGQFIIVMPDQDAVIVVTSETANMQDELDLIWKHLLPGIAQGPLPMRKRTGMPLRQQLASLALPRPEKGMGDPVATKLRISDKTFSLVANELSAQSASFLFKEKACQLTLKTKTETFKLVFGADRWIKGETTKRGPNLVARALGHFVGLPPAKVAGIYRWIDPNTLELRLRYIESPHTETFTCRFDQTQVLMEIRNSFDKSKSVELKGNF